MIQGHQQENKIRYCMKSNQIYFKIAGKKKMDRRVEPPDTFLEENHPMTISSKICSMSRSSYPAILK
jgi:hypothetical protein